MTGITQKIANKQSGLHTPMRLDICVSASSNLVHIEGENCGKPMATMTGGAKEQRIADALRLAYCWNCHDELLEALEYAAEILASYKSTSVGVHGCSLDKARAAIAKARGEAV